MKHTIVDTGIWFALFDKTDSYYNHTKTVIKVLESTQLILPFPTFYETFNTEFVKKHGTKLWRFLNKKEYQMVSDHLYKEKALKILQETNYRNFSLVDLVIREMISDNKLKIDYLCTFNIGDFVDVCAVNRVEIISNT